MRWCVPLVLLLLCGPALSADTFLYVSLAGERKIALYRVDPEKGALKHTADIPVQGEPGALTTDPAQKFLFASLRAEGKLSSFRIDPGSGKLTPVSTVPAGSDPAHLSTDVKGKFLLTAYYVAAKVTVHRIGARGELSAEPVQSVPTADKAHAIVPDHNNRFVFVPHTGPNTIFQFSFDEATGRLEGAKVPRLRTGPETGPRHLVFHPSKALAYVVNEQGNSVTAYPLDERAGTLRPTLTVPTLPRDFAGSNATAEIKVHPSGKFLYASNRGHDSVAVFAIDRSGALTALGHDATERNPRSFTIDPSGQFLYAAGESSGKLACYRIEKTGRLKRLATLNVGRTPWWVMAVRFPVR